MAALRSDTRSSSASVADSASASTNGPMCRSTYRRGPSESTSARRMTSSRCSASAAMCSIWASTGPRATNSATPRGFGAGRAEPARDSCCPRSTRRPATWRVRSTRPLGVGTRAGGAQPAGHGLGRRDRADPGRAAIVASDLGRPPGQPFRRSTGWYRSDLHTHTVHSDGRRRITEMAAAATSAGLDFIVSTDHNTNSANRAWAAPRTTAWRSSQVRRSPPATGIGWRSRCLLAAGLTGGTHRAMASSPPTPRGCGRTAASWWAAATLTRRVNRSGGRRQSCTRRTLRRRTSSRDDGTATAGPGETLTVRPGAAVTVTARVSGAPDASVALVTEGGCMRRAKTDASGDGELTWTSFGGQARFARVEVRRRARSQSMVALSNPVWLQSL